ncbi:MAG: hypothetical protein GKS00_19605 [Alphaproteobacteria bacterium]|nr:hypothetical protein [Alphaproteobacteria bacterium]
MTDRKGARRPTKKESVTLPDSGLIPEESGYGKMMFGLIRTRLKSTEKRRAYIPPDLLANALRRNPGIPLPPEIHDYLCDFLEGKIVAPAGRPTDTENPLSLLKRVLIPSTYTHYLAWLRQRKRSIGLEGWKQIRKADWWQGPPNERAARMTCRRLQLKLDWRRVHNIVSEAKK